MTVQSKHLPPSTIGLRYRRYPMKPYLRLPQVHWPQALSKDVWCNDIAQINAELTRPYVYIADTSSGSATPSVQADLQSTTGSGRLAKRRFYILVAPTLSISTNPDSCPWHPKIEPCTRIWWSTLCLHLASTRFDPVPLDVTQQIAAVSKG